MYPPRPAFAPTVARGHTTRTVWPYTLVPLGDRALTIDFAGLDGGITRDLIRCLDARLHADAHPAVTGRVPGIRSLTLHYEPRLTSYAELVGHIRETIATLAVVAAAETEPIAIPVCYGGDFGPDLGDVAGVHGTTPDAIIALHAAGRYTVAMIGFLPGFPYLEGLAAELHTPRRASPRTAVPAGSVGIGGGSTGIYPYTSPGGWHLIGRTPRALFDPLRDQPSLLQPGDRVQFIPISADQFREQSGSAPR